MINLEKIKKHIKVDGNDEDDLITLYMQAAIENTTSRMKMDNDMDASRAYDLAVCIQTAWYYVNRGDEDRFHSDPPGYRNLVALHRPGKYYV